MTETAAGENKAAAEENEAAAKENEAAAEENGAAAMQLRDARIVIRRVRIETPALDLPIEAAAKATWRQGILPGRARKETGPAGAHERPLIHAARAPESKQTFPKIVRTETDLLVSIPTLGLLPEKRKNRANPKGSHGVKGKSRLVEAFTF